MPKPAKPKLGIGQLVQNSVGTLVRQLGAGVLQLLTVIVIARALGPEGNGQYAIALLLPTMLYRFLEMGLPTANAHFIGSNRVVVQTALDTTLQWFRRLAPLGLLIGLLIVGVFGRQWFPGVPPLTLWLALAIYPVLLLQTLLVSIFQGLQNFKVYNLTLLLQPAITLALSLGAIATGKGTLSALMLAYLAGAVVTLAVSYGILIRQTAAVDVAGDAAHRDKTAERRDRKQAIERYSQQIRRYAIKSHLSIALAFFNYRVDVYLLNLLGDTESTGVYVIATQMVEKLWLLSAAVGLVMLPLISQLTNEEDRRRRITPLLFMMVLLLTGAAGMVTGVLAVPVVAVLFGEGYEFAAVIMQVLLPGIVAWAGARVLAQDITARGKPELNIYMNSGVLLVNVVGNLLLIPKYGSVGAAIATTIAYCLFTVQMLFFYTRLAKVQWKSAIADSFELSKKKLGTLIR